MLRPHFELLVFVAGSRVSPMGWFMTQCRSGRGAHECEALEERRLLASSLVGDLTPATVGSAPRQFASLGGVGYFVARGVGAAANTYGLWKTDGTPAGTSAVREGLLPGPVSAWTAPRA